MGPAPATNGKRAERSKRMGLLGGSRGKDDKDEGKMDRAKGRMKEAGGALTGDKGKKRKGRSDRGREGPSRRRATSRTCSRKRGAPAKGWGRP